MRRKNVDIDDICINKNVSIKESMKHIDKCGLGIAFVVDENKRLIGVVSDGDIRHCITDGINIETTKIEKIMNPDAITLPENYKEIEIENIISGDVKNKIPFLGTIKVPILDKDKKVKDIVFISKNGYERKLNDNNLKIKHVQRILVVGGAGYLGSVLCQHLLQKGYFVRILDNLLYGDMGIKPIYFHKNFEFINGDIRNLHTLTKAIKNIDAVVHLASIVGDNASKVNPEETIKTNYLATKMLAELCKYNQINRFILASTCSVYGARKTKNLNENSYLNPISLYAEMKLKSERGILSLVDENFSPTILRMATLYGVSPRMRFDLVINGLTIKAIKNKKIIIFGGDQWRPFLHVTDASNAYIMCIESHISKIKGMVFNLCSENLKISDVGRYIKDIIPDIELIIDEKQKDKRSYHVSSNKIKDAIDYKSFFNVKKGIEEIKQNVYKNKYDDYPNSKYTNYEYLNKLKKE